jgi:Family of unknown function (DUF5419)
MNDSDWNAMIGRMKKPAAKAGFDKWMAKVDAYIANKFGGIDSNDLPDWNYEDAFEDGASPSAAAKAAIRAAKDF